jgi:hypothetical protein
MSDVTLNRIDPARNMRRFYSLDVQPDLFGGFAVVKEWGRIGARSLYCAIHATCRPTPIDGSLPSETAQ